jgi:carboxyl-terminal processing protease
MLNTRSRRLALFVGLLIGFYPSSTDRLGSIWFPVFGLRYDFSSGHAVVPLEEIFPNSSFESDADVTRHALRIIEQHYVQRERLQSVRLLSSGIKALAREHGGDIELGFIKGSGELSRLQLSSQRTIQLCPSTSRQSAEICHESGVLHAQALPEELVDMQVVLRVGLRVFGIPLSVDPGMKSLDLIGRFVVPEYARLRGVSVAQAVHTYLNGILDELDPHSSYMTHEEYRELRSGTRGQFGGVGLVIDESQELPVIREVVPNSPAHMSGIRPGDVLLKVGNHISAFRTLDSVLRDIRELAVETAAPVWFFRPSSRRVYRSYLAREEIPTRSAELRLVEGHPEVLHIRVTGFSNHTADDVYALFEHAQLTARGKLKMMLLDLRGNPGGLLDQAIQVSDLFIRQGRIVSTRSRFEEQIEQATRGIKIDLPLVVLVNSSSASASEIVAGALKDHGRALVVGERTFGKGSVQSLFELSTGTALKLTVAHYFTPAGQSLQGVGVEPHISIKLVQPQDDHLWMSGSSEVDREEHLASHLLNPVKAKNQTSAAHQIMLSMWALAQPEGQVLEGLRPLNFSYPVGDNTQTITRLSEDPIARVALRMGQAVFGGRPLQGKLTEKPLRDAFKKVSAEEGQILRSSLETQFSKRDAVWRNLPKGFFDTSADERQVAGTQQGPRVAAANNNAPSSAKGGGKSPTSGPFRDFMSLFGVLGGTRDSRLAWPFFSSRVSLSANALMAWQGPSQILLSLASGEIRHPIRNATMSALLGLKLDESHDGPVVWLPVQFNKSADKQQWISSVRLPKAVRGYLSTLPAQTEKPAVVGQLKWKLGDEPLLLGPLQIPPLAKRHGRLSGQLSNRNGQIFLQIHYNRLNENQSQSVDSSAAEWMGANVLQNAPIEMMVATLSDDRIVIESDVMTLQRVAEGEYRGESEVKLSPVTQHGLGFGGLVGGIVRSGEGDVLTSAPLLWIGDEGVFPIQENSTLRPTSPLEW